jgi:hypothetical protein
VQDPEVGEPRHRRIFTDPSFGGSSRDTTAG